MMITKQYTLGILGFQWPVIMVFPVYFLISQVGDYYISSYFIFMGLTILPNDR